MQTLSLQTNRDSVTSAWMSSEASSSFMGGRSIAPLEVGLRLGLGLGLELVMELAVVVLANASTATMRVAITHTMAMLTQRRVQYSFATFSVFSAP